MREGPPELIAEELVVTAHYLERQHPGRSGRLFTSSYYNPSEQVQVLTFPPGETRVSGTFTSLVDDVPETARHGEDHDIVDLTVDPVPYARFAPQFRAFYRSGRGTANDLLVIFLRDINKAVSIEAVDNSLDMENEDNEEDNEEEEEESTETPPTIEEGDTAEFLSRAWDRRRMP